MKKKIETDNDKNIHGRNWIDLEKYEVNIDYCCDRCHKHLTKLQYKRGQGLCLACIMKIH